MGNYLRILTIVCLSILLSSCGTNEAPQNIPKIIGTVTDTDGNLLNNVSVYFIYHFSDVPTHQLSKEYGVDSVSFLYFTAEEHNSSVQLNWGTASELNNRGFEIERKYEGSEYSTIAFIEGNGTSSSPHYYVYIDRNITSGTYFYQLKQIDLDGGFQYSQEVMIETLYPGADTLYQNYPNPFDSYTKFSFSLGKKDSTRLDLMDYHTHSQLYNFINTELASGNHSVEFHNLQNYPNDVYIVKYIIYKNDTTFIEHERNIFLNRSLGSELLGSVPNAKTENGEFEVDISSFPFHQIINRTSALNWETIGRIQATNLITFVLAKSGYKTLELDYSVDEFNQNVYAFKMEKL